MLNYPSSNMGVPFWICVLALKEYFFPPKVTMVIPKTLPKHKPLCTSKHKFRQTTTWIWEFLGFLCFFTQGVLVVLVLTMRCWKSHERMMLVACLGRTPRLFLDFLSSPSRREVRSRFTCQDKRNEERIGWKWWWATQKMSKSNTKWEWDEWKKPGT